MNIGVVSDSHGDRQALKDLLAAMGRLDALCFLGDMSRDALFLEEQLGKRSVRTAFYAVRGNNDSYSKEPEEMVLTLEGCKILMVHGHRQRVKQGLMSLSLRAQEVGAQVALFGHTHRPHMSCDHGVLLLNPGAAGRGLYSLQPSRAAVLCIGSAGEMQVREIICP